MTTTAAATAGHSAGRIVDAGDKAGRVHHRTAGLQIDWTRCDGHGLCAALLAGAVTRDEWGYPVIDVGALAAMPVSAINRAVTACPALALRRTDDR